MGRKYKNYGRRASKKFGGYLKICRKEAKLKLKDAAIKLGIKCKSPAAYLSQIENGKRPIPERLLIKVPDIYGIPAEKVLEKAYSPQLALPFLSSVIESTKLTKPLDDYIKELKNKLNDKDKKELLSYGTFLLMRRKLISNVIKK